MPSVLGSETGGRVAACDRQEASAGISDISTAVSKTGFGYDPLNLAFSHSPLLTPSLLSLSLSSYPTVPSPNLERACIKQGDDALAAFVPTLSLALSNARRVPTSRLLSDPVSDDAHHR